MVLDYCPSRLLTFELGINFVHQTEINTEIVQFALLNCVTLGLTHALVNDFAISLNFALVYQSFYRVIQEEC